MYIQHVERRRRGLKRANLLVKKHENGPPPKEQHYDHWGYPYLLAGPWVCPLFFDQSMYTSSISNPLPGSGVNADDNIGGCATGCGYLAHCSSSSTMGGQAVLDMGGIIADVFDISNDGGGDGGKLHSLVLDYMCVTDQLYCRRLWWMRRRRLDALEACRQNHAYSCIRIFQTTTLETYDKTLHICI